MKKSQHRQSSVLIQTSQTTKPGDFSFNFNRETWTVTRRTAKHFVVGHQRMVPLNMPGILADITSGALIRRKVRRSALRAIVEAQSSPLSVADRQRVYQSLCPSICDLSRV